MQLGEMNAMLFFILGFPSCLIIIVMVEDLNKISECILMSKITFMKITNGTRLCVAAARGHN